MRFTLALLVCLCACNSFAADITRTEVLASVRIGEGGGCSGTIIACGPEVAYGISAAHCGATPGQVFKVGFVNGEYGWARWKKVDKKTDLALFVCWAEDVLSYTPVPDVLPSAAGYVTVGFPHTAGPKLASMKYERVGQTNGREMVQLSLMSGEVGPGSSGAGVFRGGVLTSVLTNGSDGGPMYGCTHEQLIKFIQDNTDYIREGVPLAQCVDGVCKKNDAGRWTPSPNLEIKLPRDGTFPDRESSKIIVALSKRVDALEAMVSELVAKAAKEEVPPPPPEPKGPTAEQVQAAVDKLLATKQVKGVDGQSGRDGVPGAAGPSGRDGQDGKPGTITVILIGADGKEISRASAVQSGSVVKLNVKQFRE